MAKQEECKNCKRAKQSEYGGIKCTYYGKVPAFDANACPNFMSKNASAHSELGSEVSPSGKNGSVSRNGSGQRCPECGQVVPQGATACPNCGFPMEMDDNHNTQTSNNTHNQDDSKDRICPDCGKRINTADGSCPYCGCPNDGGTTKTQSTYRCPDCGAALPPNAVVCPQCGCTFRRNNANSKFASQSLIQGEKILCTAEWHAINYVFFALLGIASLIFLVLWLMNMSQPSYYRDTVTTWSYFLCFVMFAFLAIYGTISLSHNEFVVTNRRIIIKSGIIRRASYELRLEKLESIQVYQGILGRFLGYGTIVVHGVGASRQSVMRLTSPMEFRQHIFTELSNQNN